MSEELTLLQKLMTSKPPTRRITYIVAACNAVPRLVEMVQAMSSVMAGIPDVELTPDEILWDFFEDTEPKE